MITPRDFLKMVIGRWEGLYSDNPGDTGNWAGGKLIGTMRGVTPNALAAHRGINADSLTPDDMKALSLDEAAEIGMTDFYQRPHFDMLEWGPATAALLDFGWGAGPGQAVKSMQRLVGANPDGGIGPLTASAYNVWITRIGWQGATQAVHDMRCAFYRQICNTNPSYNQFLQGWINRADWASGINPQWAALWDAPSPAPVAMPPIPEVPPMPKPPPLLEPAPDGFIRQPDGNIIREDVSQSGIVKGANVGQVVTAAAGTVTVTAGAASQVKGLLPEHLSDIGAICVTVIVLALLGVAFWYFRSVKAQRIDLNKRGIA